MTSEARLSALQLSPSPTATHPCFVGGRRVRLRVRAGASLTAALPTVLRQLNFVDASAQSGEVDLREIVLVDGDLPDALEICRAQPAEVAKIMTTRNATFDLRRRCAEAGIDALVADPIDPRELGDWLEHFDDRGLDRRARVLVVDDDDLAAEAVAALLGERGIETAIVDDPTRVFEALDRGSFDLVLMDLEMPQVNGIDLARMIRLNRSHLSVPIAFLSGGGDTETQMLARRFGGDDFISKRTPRDLLARLVELRVERAHVLRTLIERDGLTGLVDHLRFVERIGQEAARSRRTGGHCALVMIDIDHFKTVNDTWGHQAGDLVLRRLASTLVAWLRRTDVVGRYGGEEFGVLMLDTSPERAAPVIEAFLRHFSTLEMVAGAATFHVTFSAGIAGIEGTGDTAGLVAAADRALYRAKSGGRNRVVVDAASSPATPAPAPGSTRPRRARPSKSPLSGGSNDDDRRS